MDEDGSMKALNTEMEAIQGLVSILILERDRDRDHKTKNDGGPVEILADTGLTTGGSSKWTFQAAERLGGIDLRREGARGDKARGEGGEK